MQISDSATVAAIALVVTTGLNFFYRWVQEQSDRRRSIESRTDKMIQLAISYPVVERDRFINAWKPGDDSDNAIRYDNYCTHVFNLLEELHRHYNADHDKMHRVLAYKEIIEKHAHWWSFSENKEPGYNPDFRAFVDDVLKE